VFHVEPDGWVYNGSIDVTCTENLTRLGMTVVTAREVAPESCNDNDPSLSTGSIRPDQQGSRVAALQIALVNLGYVLPIDGRYGPLTESAVVDFQERNGLIVDGIAGRQTQAALGI
jgi:peptidoglycan hydrolase-like protein with peptidoglycan-binding domain